MSAVIAAAVAVTPPADGLNVTVPELPVVDMGWLTVIVLPVATVMLPPLVVIPSVWLNPV